MPDFNQGQRAPGIHLVTCEGGESQTTSPVFDGGREVSLDHPDPTIRAQKIKGALDFIEMIRAQQAAVSRSLVQPEPGPQLRVVRGVLDDQR